MPIALEKQRQVKKYLDRIVEKKRQELEKDIETKTKGKIQKRYENRKREIEAAIIPLMESFNKALETLHSEAKRRRYSVTELLDYCGNLKVEPLELKVDGDEVKSSLRKDIEEEMDSSVQARRLEIEQKEMEIAEKILFAEDKEIAQLVRDFKSMKVGF